jgi:hypothetical protein
VMAFVVSAASTIVDAAARNAVLVQNVVVPNHDGRASANAGVGVVEDAVVHHDPGQAENPSSSPPTHRAKR